MKLRTCLAVTAALVGAACSSTTPIGALEVAGASGSAATGASPIPPGTAAYVPSAAQVLEERDFINPKGMSGDWVGYFENLQFGSGSDAVVFHLGVDEAGRHTVSVTLGAGVVPPPPSDAFDEWPRRDVPAEGRVDVPKPIEGFAYTAHEVTWQGNRLKFSLLHAEPWGAWCALQTSYPPADDSSTEFSCNASYNTDLKTQTVSFCEYTDVPQARCTPYHQVMCWPKKLGYCACNDTGCGADSMNRTFYDVTFSADHADGSAVDRTVGGEWPSHNVRLKPAAP